MKKILFLLFVVLFVSTNVSAAINNFQIPTPIPLGKNVIMSGQLDTNASGVLCSFFIQDMNYNVVKRLSDEYTNQAGFFASDYWATREPVTYRETDYIGSVDCGPSFQTSQVFHVSQREGVENQVIGDVLFVKDNEYLIFVAIGLITLVVIIVGFLAAAFRWY